MNSNYVVMVVVLIAWVSIFMYILKLDRKVDKMKK
ncbi:MAG: CcmD family protein [candidate division Zixibacteria bacterium]|nr:CcmD family protein [candidate division Zixibacteria bacterium]